MLRIHSSAAALAIACLVAGCGSAGADDQEVGTGEPKPGTSGALAASCRVAVPTRALPSALHESSGIAIDPSRPDLLWSHNDRGNDPVLYAFDREGRIRASVPVSGVTPVDWEDIDAGPCPDDPASPCLFLADVGDNRGARATVEIHVIRLPDLDARTAGPPTRHSFRYPDGPRDAEALFIRAGEPFIVTKGDRTTPVSLFRYPGPLSTDGVRTLERVRDLFDAPYHPADRITAAAATPDGDWIGVRSERALFLFPGLPLTEGAEARPSVIDLTPLGETQGEGLAITAGGFVWLSSEAGSPAATATFTGLHCTLPDLAAVAGTAAPDPAASMIASPPDTAP